MSLQKLLVKNIYGVGIYKYIGEFLFFLSSVVISRLLVPGEFGVISMATIFYRFLISFTDLGVSEAIIRETKSDFFLANAHRLFLIIGMATGGVLALLAYPVSVFFEQPILFPVMLAYALTLFLYAFPKGMIAALRKENKLLIVARGELVAVVFQVFLSIILAWLGFSFWSLVLPHIFTPFLYYFFYRQYVTMPVTSFSNSGISFVWVRVKSLAYNFGSLNFIHYWEKTIDNLMVGKLYGGVSLGLYSRAYTMMDLPGRLLDGHLNNLLLPLLAGSNLSGKEMKTEMIHFIKFISSITTFPAIVFILFPNELSVFLWGDRWVRVGDYLGILGIALLVFSFDRLTISLFVLFRKERQMLVKGIIMGLSSILLVFVGSFYSIETMIYLYLIGIFLVGVPATVYFGYYKSFNFSFYEIADMMGYHFVSGLLLLIMKFLDLQTLLIYPCVFISMVSLVRVVSYVRILKEQWQ